MRILLSAYACEPEQGSERGKGWDFAVELGRQGHDVTVLTCGSHHRAAIERYVALRGKPRGVEFAWHDVPRWPGPGYEDARHIRLHYMLWQMTARRRARDLVAHTDFDVVHHLTWTVLRWPSFLGNLGPRFVFGPVGGGQVTPWRLRMGFPRRGWSTELKRDLINLWSRVDPIVHRCLSHADVILLTDAATLDHVPRRFRSKSFLIADVYAPLAVDMLGDRDSERGPAILFAGRLEYWKGAQLALGAVKHLVERNPGLVLSIAGTGPEEDYLRCLAAQLGIAEHVRFLGALPHHEMSGLYARNDVFLFPSLHDSGPHVIGEALAHGLPVVCLDLGGPALAVNASCGAVVSTRSTSRTGVEARLADAVQSILGQPDLDRLRQDARRRAESLSYPQHIAEMVDHYYVGHAGDAAPARDPADEAAGFERPVAG